MSITKRYFTSLLSIRSYAWLMSWILISSMSDTMPCSAQKSSISCVSAMPPISEPARRRRLKIRLNTFGDGWSCSGAPTSVIVPSRLSRFRNGFRSCCAATVLTIRSKLLACAFICASSFEITTSCAPSRLPSSIFDGEVVNSTTCAPIARASFTPMWPRPPRPTMPTFLPGPAPHWRSGE